LKHTKFKYELGAMQVAQRSTDVQCIFSVKTL